MKYLKKIFSVDVPVLTEEFNFKDIYEATEFMRKALNLFNLMDHHPDYFCLEGKKITIKITTHSQGGVTYKDHEVVDRLRWLIKDCCKPFNPHLFK
jgi:4a-hydroxytetrahydrobiopterin dehydratase